MGFVFLEEVIESFEVVEWRGGTKIENGGERVAKHEIVICST